MKTLKDGWMTYRALLPVELDETQLRELEQAFYAGVQHFISLLCDLDGSAASAEEGAAQLSRWRTECGGRVREILDEVHRRWRQGNV